MEAVVADLNPEFERVLSDTSLQPSPLPNQEQVLGSRQIEKPTLPDMPAQRVQRASQAPTLNLDEGASSSTSARERQPLVKIEANEDHHPEQELLSPATSGASEDLQSPNDAMSSKRRGKIRKPQKTWSAYHYQRIIKARENGEIVAQVARSMGMPIPTAKLIITKHLRDPNYFGPRQRGGKRPPSHDNSTDTDEDSTELGDDEE